MRNPILAYFRPFWEDPKKDIESGNIWESANKIRHLQQEVENYKKALSVFCPRKHIECIAFENP